ncbi:MAG: VWA domain-containing protein [Acidobacteria bacterium]|nr:VWA domain-containing protein [Acidobacteriota bacterium]
MRNNEHAVLRGRRTKGQVIVLIAVLATFLIGLAGIAVDLVMVYSVKTFLATATDSAAMGGARARERGVTYSDYSQEIARTTEKLFDANFPDGLLLTGSTGQLTQNVVVAAAVMDPLAGPGFIEDPDMQPGMREIRVHSEAYSPTMFMRVFGVNAVHVRSSAYAARRDVNIVVVVDRSASLKNAGAWGDVQDAAITFIEQFDNNRDRVGLVTFGTGANVDYPLSSGFKTGNAAKNLILSQVVPDSAGTNYSTGLWLAYSELLRINDPGALNAIVFFTDGQPSAFSAAFKMKTSGTGAHCTSSTEEGTLAAGQDTSVPNTAVFRDIYGFWDRHAGPAPVNGGNTSYDHPPNPRCSNLGSPSYIGPNTELAFNSSQPWPAAWTATEAGGISKTFCIKPGAGGCAGDAGDFFYSVNDSRLYNNSTGNSDRLFRGSNVHNAAKNLSLNIAQTARRDALLGGVNIHAIGLGGYGYDADVALMKRIANDPSDSYGVVITAAGDEPQGTYNYAPTVADLKEAFSRVRSEVMRLTR